MTDETKEGARWTEGALHPATDQALYAEVQRLRRLEAAAIEFCERCERGEVRSQRSYRLFRAALDGV